MSFNVTDDSLTSESAHPQTSANEKNSEKVEHLEQVVTETGNLVYNDNEEEPELHARTYFALAAMFTLNLVQVVALQGPPAVVSRQHKLNHSPLPRYSKLTVFGCSLHTLERTSTTLPVRLGFPTPCP